MDETEVSQRAPSGAELRRTDSGCTHTWGAVRRKRRVVLNIAFLASLGGGDVLRGNIGSPVRGYSQK